MSCIYIFIAIKLTVFKVIVDYLRSFLKIANVEGIATSQQDFFRWMLYFSVEKLTEHNGNICIVLIWLSIHWTVIDPAKKKIIKSPWYEIFVKTTRLSRKKTRFVSEGRWKLYKLNRGLNYIFFPTVFSWSLLELKNSLRSCGKESLHPDVVYLNFFLRLPEPFINEWGDAASGEDIWNTRLWQPGTRCPYGPPTSSPRAAHYEELWTAVISLTTQRPTCEHKPS